MTEMEDRVADCLIDVPLYDYQLTKSEARMLARAAIEAIWHAMGNAALADVQTRVEDPK